MAHGFTPVPLACSSLGMISVDGPITLDSSMLMITAALGGVGLAWVPDWMVQQHIESGALVGVLGNWTPSFPGLCFYYPPHRHSSAGLRAFVAVIRESFKRRS